MTYFDDRAQRPLRPMGIQFSGGQRGQAEGRAYYSVNLQWSTTCHVEPKTHFSKSLLYPRKQTAIAPKVYWSNGCLFWGIMAY